MIVNVRKLPMGATVQIEVNAATTGTGLKNLIGQNERLSLSADSAFVLWAGHQLADDIVLKDAGVVEGSTFYTFQSIYDSVIEKGLIIATILALYMEDLRHLLPIGADPVFHALLMIVFVIFLVEFILTLYIQGCEESFYLVLDFFAMISLIPSMFFWEDLMSEIMNNNTAESLGLVRASRAARAGSRIGRMMRMTKVLKQCTKSCQRRSRTQDGEVDADRDESMDMGRKMSDMITRKVIVIVFVMLLVMPWLEAAVSDEFPVYGLDMCEKYHMAGNLTMQFNDSKRLYQLQMADKLLHLQINSVDWVGPLSARRATLRASAVSSYTSSSGRSSALFDASAQVSDESWFAMGRTTFVLLMLGLGSILFAKDATNLSTRIATPLKFLSKDMADVSDLQLNDVALERADIYEVNLMQDSFARMKTGLKSFIKFVPKMVVRNLLRAGKPTTLGMERKHITIFFSNISNFDVVTEKVDTMQMMELLGEYFHEMSLVIEETNGTLIEFVGDEILALWNAPQDVANHAAVCCGAALRMQERLLELRPAWRARGWPDIDVRMGINSASVFVGNLGAPDRMKYGVLGDGVNLAARLQMLNNRYDTKICLSEVASAEPTVSTAFRTRCLDVVAVKGKNIGIRTHQLMSAASTVSAEHDLVKQRYSDGFAHYLKREFKEAITCFEDLAGKLQNEGHPADQATKMLLARAEGFAANPPPAEWDGVEKMTAKHF